MVRFRACEYRVDLVAPVCERRAYSSTIGYSARFPRRGAQRNGLPGPLRASEPTIQQATTEAHSVILES